MKFTGATKFHRKSGGGPTAKREPGPEGLGNPQIRAAQVAADGDTIL